MSSGILIGTGLGVYYNNATIVVVDIVTIAVVAALLRRAGFSLRDLLPRFTLADLGWGLLFSVILVVGFAASNFLANLIVYHGPPPRDTSAPSVPLWLGWLSLIVMPATIALAEELLYRGYGQHLLTLRWGRWAAWLVVAFLFGIQHIALAPVSVGFAASRFFTTFFAGLIFGALLWWRRRLWPLVIAHWVLDVLGLGLPSLFLAMQG
ncbi:CPBP family intramembrane glutamic endopeptidase [Nigerium massiliense]|uniref:CPBP family intramembrane glutamic endopeptidase n=1 Tax=Nigerium massiliense TaxID=1522317 RepID=UPI0012FDEF3B|nr:type II CAAX endopeptidase family protein [Nigerium massiliense]